MEKIHWAPKVRPEKLWALYQSDARGLLDEDLLEKVGFALLARCENILLIDKGRVICPCCGWQVTGAAYDQSIRHRELHNGKAGPAFEAFAAAYPRAATPQARMLAIDQLIHAFHWDLELQLPNRPAGNNLIEGSLEQVIDLLDRLTFGDDPQAQAAWRATLAVMQKRRAGQRPEE
jgi:hypothetical protein